MNQNKGDLIWNIILIVSIILIINGMGDVNDLDKKTAEVAQDKSTVGAIGIGAFVMKKSVFLSAAAIKLLIWPLVAVFIASPTVLSRFISIFKPAPTIPIFVWIIGGVMLMFILMKKN